MKNKKSPLKVFALGGLGEIGKNMYVVEYGEDLIVIDSGLKFPEEDMLGIDLVIPDITYLVENKDRLRAIVLTHGHEDHIGALPFVLKELDVPLYGTKLTLGLAKVKFQEHGLMNKVQIHEVTEESTLQFGPLSVSFFRVNHSIPDAVGVAVYTPEGIVVHTGDFKFDYTPVGEKADLGKMAALGEKGVLCLLSDSTNAERPGHTLSERTVGETIRDVFHKSDGRIIFATFASNVYRLQQVIEAADIYGRKIAVIGRSMENVFRIGAELGYLNIPKGMLIDVNEIDRYSADRVVIVCTGSQGEPMAALTRIATGSHRSVKIYPGDTVIIAAQPIPGNARFVGRTIDLLMRAGAEVVFGSVSGFHVSGHGSQEELKLMLNLMKPKYFIPIHGEYRMLMMHKKLAEATGVESRNIFILDNGEPIEFVDGVASKGAKLPSGMVLIDGKGVGDIGNIVLRDRRKLSEDGLIVVVVTISKDQWKIVSGPDLVTRGFVYVRESEEMLNEATRLVQQSLHRLTERNVKEWSQLKSKVIDVLEPYFYEKTQRKPMILPVIMEV
ncbi:ribonuclease J [Ammoniphilus oxalaticus]|uniref:Ribonuclease J n=1 Tax=Ammoniphilus oxalaticus TaxID=66863 RepID=A0A419SJ98_9BACL|nr:ribonuclease J [Ammoniphilus oxalaticus]RKD24047.1 ribonuclease J [Ammoniphilus oxalaticus]